MLEQAPQLRVVADFDRRVEGVHVDENNHYTPATKNPETGPAQLIRELFRAFAEAVDQRFDTALAEIF